MKRITPALVDKLITQCRRPENNAILVYYRNIREFDVTDSATVSDNGCPTPNIDFIADKNYRSLAPYIDFDNMSDQDYSEFIDVLMNTV